MSLYDRLLTAMCLLRGKMTADARAAWLRSLRPALEEMRRLYRNMPADVDYTDGRYRDVYMLAYFPNYVMPVYEVLDVVGHAARLRAEPSDLRVVCFGAGPAPEMLGILAWLADNEYSAQALFRLYDAYPDAWSELRSLTVGTLAPTVWDGSVVVQPHQCDLLCQCGDCETGLTCEGVLSQADIWVVQNCLNDLKAPPARVAEALARRFEVAKPGALLIVIDLPFDSVRTILSGVVTALEQTGSVRVRQEQDGLRTCARADAVPDELLQSFFAYEDWLRPRGPVDYHSCVLEHL